MKTNITIGFVILFLICTTVKCFTLYLDEHKTAIRLIDNLKASEKENEYFKAKNGNQAVKIQSQELTIAELKKVHPSVIQDLHNLYVPVRHLDNYTSAGTDTKERIVTKIKDSIRTDTLRIGKINYSDPWLSINGTVKNDTADLTINSRDEIKVINYLSRRPHPWLWIFGGRRHPECLISNSNPHNKIAIRKSVIIKR